MNRVAIDLGFIQIYWYSLMIILGVILGLLLVYREIKHHDINKEQFFNMIFYAIIFGFLGARLYYVIFNLDYYAYNLLEIFAVWHGGLAIHGGILGAMVTIYFFSKKYQFSFLKILDICTVSLIIGQVIGRWGNFFNSEAHGGIVTLEFLQKLHLPQFIINGMYIDGNYYHPTFLYESLLNFICFVVLLILRRNKKIKEGMIFSIYLIWYGLIRFFIESLRTDSLMMGPIKFAQVISIIFIICGIILLIKSKNRELYNK